MLKTVLSNIIELIFILPLIWYGRRPERKSNILIVLFLMFFVINQLLLKLPQFLPELNFIEGNWNWQGKVYAACGSIIFCFIYKPYLVRNNFIKIKQKKSSIKNNVLLLLVIITLYFFSALFFNNRHKWDNEALYFQLTMPGLEEEIAFRGIMTSLLTTALTHQITLYRFKIEHPSIWIIAILFGLVHSFQFDTTWKIYMNWGYFIQACIFGWIMGWMTVKSRSILFPTVTHQLANFFLTLATMIK